MNEHTAAAPEGIDLPETVAGEKRTDPAVGLVNITTEQEYEQVLEVQR